METRLKTSLIFTICLVVIGVGPSLIFADPNEKPWSPNTKINWSDFQGTPTDEYDAWLSWYDVTDWTLNLDNDGVNCSYSFSNLDFTAVMIKDESWVNEDKKDRKLLNHERKHLDLAQAGLQSIQDELKDQVYTCDPALDTEAGLIQKTENFVDVMIDRNIQLTINYDDAWIDFGNKGQREWNVKINSLLDIYQYGQYSNSTGTPLRLEFTGDAGKDAIFEDTRDWDKTNILTVDKACNDDDFFTILVQFGGAIDHCIITNGSDLIIWTSQPNRSYGTN